MGTSHFFIPVTKDIASEEFFHWCGVVLSENIVYGRFPNWDELLSAMRRCIPEDYHLQSSPTGAAVTPISGNGYLLLADRYYDTGYSFYGDRAFLTKILHQLPSDCGTFLIVTNGSSLDPELVMVPQRD